MLQGIKQYLPLGAHQLIPLYNKSDIKDILRYTFMVDHLVEHYQECKDWLFDNHVKLNLELSIEEAFYMKPGAMCTRTNVRAVFDSFFIN